MEIIAQTATPTEKPSRYDGLTKTQRTALYEPSNYVVQQTGPIRFLATCAGQTFRVVVAYGRFFFVHSNTGNDHLVTLSQCGCGDFERACQQGRRCKHVAASEAVEAFIERGAGTEERRAEALRSMRETFGD